jgi:oxygen-independent coproporphyrinogen-3 oxidase
MPIAPELAGHYVEAVAKEARACGGGRVGTVYVGGGTPSLLPDDDLARLMGALAESFDIISGAEVTMEANPGSIDGGKARMLRSLGVNRLSIGIQSFHDRELLALGRAHTADEASRAASGMGFENFSLDLIYGIPGQSMKAWEATLNRALSFGPPHVSAYELTPGPGTPLRRDLDSGSLRLPDEETVAAMFFMARDRLEAVGLDQYEISNYARPGRQCRHNLACWRRGQYLGLGLGAHSFLDGVRMRNTEDVTSYVRFIEAGESPVEETISVGREDAFRESLFLGLRLREGVDAAALSGEYGVDLLEAASELVDDGLLGAEGGRLRLTRKGMVLCNPVLVRLFERLGL